MTNKELNESIKELDFVCSKIVIGLRNNMEFGIWYSSKPEHESILNKIEAIRLILKS